MSVKVEFINPFVKAAIDVLRSEVGGDIGRGKLQLETSPATNHDVAVMIGLTGNAQGVVLYGMSLETARNIVGKMMGQEVDEFDALAQSGIAEMGNVITGLASRGLSENGYDCNITPPTLIVGNHTSIGTLDLPRIVLPLTSSCGEIVINLALREVSAAAAA
jgi:chemotaxis protein CheX